MSGQDSYLYKYLSIYDISYFDINRKVYISPCIIYQKWIYLWRKSKWEKEKVKEKDAVDYFC